MFSCLVRLEPRKHYKSVSAKMQCAVLLTPEKTDNKL